MRRNMLGLAALTVALAIGMSGCGSDTGDDQVASAGGGGQQEQDDSTKTDDAELGRRFAACMRAEGIDVPDPDPDGGMMMALPAGEEGSAAARKQDAAVEKCREFLPTGGEAPKLSPEDIESMREYSRCMRSNGLPDFPDPDPATGSIRMDADAPESDPESMRKAAEACQGVGPDMMPAGGAG